MAETVKQKLPPELVDHIKLFTGEAEWRKGKFINIKRIPKTDMRYSMLQKKPRIKQILNSSYKAEPLRGIVWFKLENGKFIVITVNYTHWWIGNSIREGFLWEMYYNTEIYLHPIH